MSRTIAYTIGYYVHHHGDGHRQRALAVAAAAGGCITLLGTGLAGRTGDVPCIDLPDDRLGTGFDGADQAATRPPALHYAPLRHEAVRARAAAIAGWIATARPALLVVDVSVEVAMLARLCATPTVYMRLAGRRTDAPHVQAFQAAAALVAPFAAALDDPGLPGWMRDKTCYCPGLMAAAPMVTPTKNTVLVVFGQGGAGGDGTALAAAARVTPGYQWRVIGPATPAADAPGNLALLGWLDDPRRELAGAEIIIGGAGDGLVNAIIAGRKPFICLPEPRPFDEQASKASRLAALGAAIVLPAWPAAENWPGLLAAARCLPTAGLAALDDARGAERMLALLEEVAVPLR